MNKIKKTLIVFSSASKLGHRDLFETDFYSFMEKNFNVIWLFDGKPIKDLGKRIKNFHIVRIKENIRFLFWTYLFYLEEMDLKKKHHSKKAYEKNSRLYISKLHKKIIELIYAFKIDNFVKFILNFLLNKTVKNWNFFSKADLFLNISTGKDLLADDLTRNAKNRKIPIFFIPAGWDHISGKPILVKPDKIMVWGKQTKKLCKKFHNLESEIIGSFKFDVYKNSASKYEAQKKLGLNVNYKYILVCGSAVVFNEGKMINKILNYLKNYDKKSYKIIYKPHPFAWKRVFDEKINFNMPNQVIIDKSIKKEFKLKDYPYLFKSIQGIITPFSTMVVEAVFNNIPCMTVGYSEKNQYNFDWKLHTILAPHLHILKNKKCIVNCLDQEEFDKKFKKFLMIINNKNKIKLEMNNLSNDIILKSNDTFNERIKNKVDRFLNNQS